MTGVTAPAARNVVDALLLRRAALAMLLKLAYLQGWQTQEKVDTWKRFMQACPDIAGLVWCVVERAAA